MAVFHLSLPVPDVERSAAFFALLGGTVTHRDDSGYVNVDLAGVQLTLAPGTPGAGGDFHLGLNVERAEFDAVAEKLTSSGLAQVVSQPHTVDAGTSMERVKMYVRCPAGYLIELKACRAGSARG